MIDIDLKINKTNSDMGFNSTKQFFAYVNSDKVYKGIQEAID